MTKLVSSDALSLIKTQIKQLTNKFSDEPILSRRNLNVCASCHQTDKSMNATANIKQNHHEHDYQNDQNNKISPRLLNASKNRNNENKIKKVISIEINKNND